jgi:hypothetical protein
MNTLEQLSLKAFQLALSRLEQPLPDALAQQVQSFSENWEIHIGELRGLTEQFEPLKTHYLEARLELQSQSADRKQFLENSFKANPNSPYIDDSPPITKYINPKSIDIQSPATPQPMKLRLSTNKLQPFVRLIQIG